jgi:2-polyprenyl-3-methyl-5-hydroxy-6-metoxy-1,4-benzoquinol methylase
MNEVHEDEMAFLESVAETYVNNDTPLNQAIRSFALKTFQPYIKSYAKALEFGCSDGFMTSEISGMVQSLTVLDGSKTFIEMARRRAGENVEFIHTLFEDYKTDKRYDCLFATYVLEHVHDAHAFLAMARSLLNEQGLLFLVVPNARALSRQLARHMGLLTDLYALTPNDLNHGHRRVYDRAMLNRDIEAAGLSQIAQGGLLLKLLADFQMDSLISSNILGDQQQEALYKMGLEYPDLAGSLFSICRAD